jgi:hypothetical protein
MEGILLVDEPIVEKGDLTPGLEGLVSYLFNILENDQSKFPILITGDWGAGKTSVLRSIQRELDVVSKIKRTIWFEAWHNERLEGLLPALMRRVWEETPVTFRKKKENKKIAMSLWRSAFAAVTHVMPLVLSAFSIPLLPDLIKILQPKDLGQNVDAVPGIENDEPPMDPGQKLRDNLKELIKKAWKGDKKKPIVFIDDLDRCSPAGTVELMDAIWMLVASGKELNLRFVVALDRTIAIQAITTKFSGISNFDGNRYLEKVFPLEFHIPALSNEESTHLIRMLLGDSKELDNDQNDALALALINPSFTNPRLMKRSINKFRLVCNRESLKEQEKDVHKKNKNDSRNPNVESDRVLAKWIAATERWPRMRHLMQKRDEQYWDQLADSIKINDLARLPDTEAVALTKEPGALAWIRNIGFLENLSLFRAAEDRLRHFGL